MALFFEWEEGKGLVLHVELHLVLFGKSDLNCQ